MSVLPRRWIIGPLLTSILCSFVSAQVAAELMLRPWPKDQLFEAQGQATFLNDGTTANANQFQLSMYNTSGRVRLSSDERASWRFGYDVTYFDIDTNDPALPSKATDNSVALGMGFKLGDQWLGGLALGVGYAAAGAFDDGNGYYGLANLRIGRELDETSSISFAIDYDGNRPYKPDVPIPGFLYVRKIDPTFEIGIGFPFSTLTWKPDKAHTFDRQLTVDVKYYFPDSADARIDYEITKAIGIFTSYSLLQEAFHDDSFSNSSDRLLFQQQRAEAGVRWNAHERVSAEFACGYAFGQEFNRGWDTSDQDRLAKPSDEGYLRVGIEVRY